jgi:hypothetical protein
LSFHEIEGVRVCIWSWLFASLRKQAIYVAVIDLFGMLHKSRLAGCCTLIDIPDIHGNYALVRRESTAP